MHRHPQATRLVLAVLGVVFAPLAVHLLLSGLHSLEDAPVFVQLLALGLVLGAMLVCMALSVRPQRMSDVPDEVVTRSRPESSRGEVVRLEDWPRRLGDGR